MRAARVLLVASPALVIGALGLAHPLFLTPASADRWQVVHLALLPAFPLLGGSLLWLLRAEWGALGWVARLAAYGYAVMYGALDAIAGIGAPQQVRHTAAAPIGDLYEIGDRLGHLGVVCLAVSAGLTGALLWRRTRSRAALLGGAISVAASLPFYRHHVFPMRGVLALVAIGVGLALLAVAEQRPRVGWTGLMETLRLFLHVLAATVWVGGQIVLAAAVPALRAVHVDAPRAVARAYNRIAWPAFGVLVATGVWNVLDEDLGDDDQRVLGIKLLLVAVSGVAAFLHTRSATPRGRALTGAGAALSAVLALLLGVVLAD